MSPNIDDDPQTKEYEMRLLAIQDLDTTAADNCAFSLTKKRLGHDYFDKIPNGFNGVDDRISVIWTNGFGKGVITPSDFPYGYGYEKIPALDAYRRIKETQSKELAQSLHQNFQKRNLQNNSDKQQYYYGQQLAQYLN
ncbi:dihydropyrimidinase [Stylonychia lemnae]|uniref:Dihydropyrimidinase n=1 Tax=Stylonychia lemnae TaxID=5949 RepID=A0A078A1V8_STYLE|nr:dihydropyrimidinase [Stylonychia lemnae]|eukprot:CDW76226.1 dihydropyrimidinase [Stylonychia lemnae]